MVQGKGGHKARRNKKIIQITKFNHSTFSRGKNKVVLHIFKIKKPFLVLGNKN
jgi:hypothetical protein